MSDPYGLHRACVDVGGVARTRDLLGLAAATRGDLDRALRDGVLVRLRPGWVAVREVPAAVGTAITHGGALGCVSRLQLEGLWVLGEHPRVHVAMRRMDAFASTRGATAWSIGTTSP